jgi:hypothetical protein
VNIEQLLRKYLYTNKSVSFPGIGKLAFSPDYRLPEAMEKNENYQLQDLNFTYNLSEEMDKDFVDFFSAQTGKIKPLASADVESFFMLSKQFINIGKSFNIDGIGAINKQDNGKYAFTPGYFMPLSDAAISTNQNKPLKVREVSPPIQVEVNSKTKSKSNTNNNQEGNNGNSRKLLLGLVSLLSLGLIGWAVYHFVFNDKPVAPTVVATTVAPNADTSKIVKIDTAIKTTILGGDSLKPTLDTATGSIAPPATTVSSGYKAIIDYRYTRAGANARAAKLKGFGHNVLIDSVGKTTFMLYVPVKDTTISIDTLQLSKINGKRPKIIVAQ